MDQGKTYDFPRLGIAVNVYPDGAGAVRGSIFHTISGDIEEDNTALLGACDGIEALMLAHACAGIDIGGARYQAGIDVALEQLVQHHE